MKCFNHPDKDAVGICKNCNKGLCNDCLTEVDNGIACTTICVEEVKLLNSLINRNKQSYKIASVAHYRNAYIYGSFGLVFVFYGIITETLAGLLSVIGILFILGALFSINSARKYKNE
ncbi:MAG: hypothetical protein ACOYLE_09685 [Bacteroidales bacterium]